MIITIKCTKKEKKAFIDVLDNTNFCPLPFGECDVFGESCGNCTHIVYEVTDDE